MTEKNALQSRSLAAVPVTVLVLLASAVFLFARLGHYALWDDESLTAMTAQNVLKTHDTTVNVGPHNIMAYRNGLLVKNFRDRYTPPLQFFFIAPFLGLFGTSNFVCRLPMALCGLVTVGLILRWLWKANPRPLVWYAAAFCLLTHVSFFLFFRQCRYYGLATLLTTLVGFLYCTGRRRGSVVGLSIALFLLLSTQYLNYMAVIGCLVIDYLIWGRKTRPLKLADWLILIVPQLIVGGFVCSIWNPVARQGGADAYSTSTFFTDRIHLFWWNWRDMFACDFIILPLLFVCPFLYFYKRGSGRAVKAIDTRPGFDVIVPDAIAGSSQPIPVAALAQIQSVSEAIEQRSAWLLRAPMALVVYIASISTFVATAVAKAGNAEVRYLAPAAPLCVGIGIVAVWGLQRLPRNARCAIIAIAICSTLLVPMPANTTRISRPIVGSSTIQWWKELVHPIDEPYTPLIAWINDPKNVPPGSSVIIAPDYMAYPLMARCPDVIIAWQLTDPPRADFKNLPDVHFKDRVPPDFIIMAGSEQSKDAVNAIGKYNRRGSHDWYERVAVLPHYWKDLYRPELIWRSFHTLTPREDNLESLYIFKHVRR